MKLKLFILASFLIVLSGCTKVYPINSSLPVSVQLKSDDIVIGNVVTHSMKYDSKDPYMKDKLYKEALVRSGYDFIFLPQYEIQKSLFSKTISIKGYGANIKK